MLKTINLNEFLFFKFVKINKLLYVFCAVNLKNSDNFNDFAAVKMQ